MRFLPLLFLIGCATADHLGPQGIERVCTGYRCYVYASADQVNRRCNTKVTEDFPLATWDDGTLRKGDDTRRARCCTVHYPDRKRRFDIWISTEGDDWKCAAHEECHIEIFWKDGDHGDCNDFGLGRKFNRMPKR